MRKLFPVAFVALAGLGTLVSACSDDFNREDAIEEMKDDFGLTQEQAECVVDGMIEEFGLDTLNADREPTEEEMSRMLDLSGECLGGDLGEIDTGDDGAESDTEEED